MGRSLSKYLLSICSMPSTFLDSGNGVLSETTLTLARTLTPTLSLTVTRTLQWEK